MAFKQHFMMSNGTTALAAANPAMPDARSDSLRGTVRRPSPTEAEGKWPAAPPHSKPAIRPGVNKPTSARRQPFRRTLGATVPSLPRLHARYATIATATTAPTHLKSQNRQNQNRKKRSTPPVWGSPPKGGTRERLADSRREGQARPAPLRVAAQLPQQSLWGQVAQARAGRLAQPARAPEWLVRVPAATLKRRQVSLARCGRPGGGWSALKTSGGWLGAMASLPGGDGLPLRCQPVPHQQLSPYGKSQKYPSATAKNRKVVRTTTRGCRGGYWRRFCWRRAPQVCCSSRHTSLVAGLRRMHPVPLTAGTPKNIPRFETHQAPSGGGLTMGSRQQVDPQPQVGGRVGLSLGQPGGFVWQGARMAGLGLVCPLRWSVCPRARCQEGWSVPLRAPAGQASAIGREGPVGWAGYARRAGHIGCRLSLLRSLAGFAPRAKAPSEELEHYKELPLPPQDLKSLCRAGASASGLPLAQVSSARLWAGPGLGSRAGQLPLGPPLLAPSDRTWDLSAGSRPTVARRGFNRVRHGAEFAIAGSKATLTTLQHPVSDGSPRIQTPELELMPSPRLVRRWASPRHALGSRS
ncbi:hypothetical protein H6P81_021718 [Aristolochia fimbriata]|uniref:Uncharacterized protein n=1 Tax=Aristolochia fimbriata TaxID=158543 RepID=A0AAV7DRT2_ARIFI|nr:hypothetical protein H6P81_021718 [Aristolochia fimbriata]